MNPLIKFMAAKPEGRGNAILHRMMFGRRFTDRTARRLLVLFEPNRISYASVFPFLYYAEEFRSHYDVEVRFMPVKHALSKGDVYNLSAATHVIAQTWLTDQRERHEELDQLLVKLPNVTCRAYLDTFANNDIRWAGVFQSANFYYKKSLFEDYSTFLKPTFGHTNLAEYYGNLYDLPTEFTDWSVPQSALPKLRLAPNFLTDPVLSAQFLCARQKISSSKYIDLHARLGGTNANGWYGEMRRHAERAVDDISGLRIARGTGVRPSVFLKELRHSKACFSPFGYGELCWRDIEAIAAGAVLIKPDMSHLRTEPDLYRDGETYIACRWDFADLCEKVREICCDDEKRNRIAQNARRVALDYLETAGPVRTYSDLFQDH